MEIIYVRDCLMTTMQSVNVNSELDIYVESPFRSVKKTASKRFNVRNTVNKPAGISVFKVKKYHDSTIL